MLSSKVKSAITSPAHTSQLHGMGTHREFNISEIYFFPLSQLGFWAHKTCASFPSHPTHPLHSLSLFVSEVMGSGAFPGLQGVPKPRQAGTICQGTARGSTHHSGFECSWTCLGTPGCLSLPWAHHPLTPMASAFSILLGLCSNSAAGVKAQKKQMRAIMFRVWNISMLKYLESNWNW